MAGGGLGMGEGSKLAIKAAVGLQSISSVNRAVIGLVNQQSISNSRAAAHSWPISHASAQKNAHTQLHMTHSPDARERATDQELCGNTCWHSSWCMCQQQQDPQPQQCVVQQRCACGTAGLYVHQQGVFQQEQGHMYAQQCS